MHAFAAALRNLDCRPTCLRKSGVGTTRHAGVVSGRRHTGRTRPIAIGTKRIDELVIFTFFDFFRIVFVANGDRTFGVGIDRFASVIGARFAVAARGFGQCAVCTFIERVGVFARIGSAFIVGIDGFTSVIGARFAYATFDLGRLAIFALQ